MEASSLSQFVLLAKSAQGRACEALVSQALEHSTVFVFGELLDCASVQALGQGGEEGRRLLELLKIFAYGTHPDYVARKGELPELTALQRRKLQLLTVLSMATKAKVIKFSDLQVALDVSTERDVEGIIIEVVYQDLVVGKMDQDNRCLLVESCACRDVREEDVDFIIDTLTAWQDSAEKMLQSLGGMQKFAQDSFENQRASREELDKLVQSVRDNLKEGDSGRARGDGGCTRMADDADEESKRAKSTRGRWMGGLAQRPAAAPSSPPAASAPPPAAAAAIAAASNPNEEILKIGGGMLARAPQDLLQDFRNDMKEIEREANIQVEVDSAGGCLILRGSAEERKAAMPGLKEVLAFYFTQK